MKRKLMSIIMAVSLLLALAPAAHAAEVTATTESELAAAFAAGDTVTLGADITLSAPLAVAAGKSVTLNLGTYTVSYTSSVPGEDMIVNRGTLIINGTTGAIEYTNTDTTAANVTVSTISNEGGGSLTVNGGTIENKSSDAKAWQDDGIYPFAIDNMGASTVTVTGGAVVSKYRSIRQFANNSTGVNAVNISGGTFTGQIWLQSLSTADEAASITVSGGTFAPVGYDGSSIFIGVAAEDAVEADISGGTFTTKIGCENPAALAGCVTGGSFSASAQSNTSSALLSSGVQFGTADSGGYSSLAPAAGSEAAIGSLGYPSLEDAIAAAEDGDTVTLLTDAEITDPIVITKSITLDGAGNTLTYTGTNRAIDVRKETPGVQLHITDLELVCSAAYCERGINYNANGTLTLTNVTVSGTNLTYALNMPGDANGATVTAEDSSLTGNIAVNIWGTDCTVTLTDCTLTSVDTNDAENYIAVMLNNDGTISAEGSEINVQGGTITALDEDGNPSGATSNATETGVINVSSTTVITGKAYDAVAVVDYGASSFYTCNSLQAAVNHAVADGGTVKPLKNLAEDVTVSGPVTVDLNGKTLTGTFTLKEGASLTAAAGLNVVSESANFVVAYENGVYVLQAHTHTLAATAAKDATCTADGNIAYWYCAGCDRYFSNAQGTVEIDEEETVIPGGHTPDKDSICSRCGKDLAPNTGDTTNGLWAVVAVLSAGAVILLAVFGKKISTIYSGKREKK